MLPDSSKPVSNKTRTVHYACMYCGYVDKPLKVDQPCGCSGQV